MQQKRRRVALITGGSRGVGAETALALADRGYDIALTYRNKAARARNVIAAVTQRKVRGLALACDMTHSGEITSLFQCLKQWTDHVDVVVLNASGGLERSWSRLIRSIPCTSIEMHNFSLSMQHSRSCFREA